MFLFSFFLASMVFMHGLNRQEPHIIIVGIALLVCQVVWNERVEAIHAREKVLKNALHNLQVENQHLIQKSP
jgi:hypothetical protein